MNNGVRVILVLGALSAGADAAASGEKFLVVGRGTRFQRGPEAARGYSVLIYAPAVSAPGDGARRFPVEKTLRLAGYRPSTAGSAVELAEAVKSASPDVVVTNLGDAREVERQLGRPGSIVLLKSMMSADSFLDAVDEAVSRIAKARKSGGPRS